MSKLFPPKFVIFLPLLLAIVFVGCSHQKTQRGHLFRGDWAFEYNRTPWIGCEADSGCPDYQNVGEESQGKGLFSCLMKDKEERKQRGFRRHCAMKPGCTAKNPCCRTLGCGMWTDPEDSTTTAALGGTAKACGLTPYCFPNNPCRLTPNCAKPVNVNPQTLALMNQQMNGGMGGLTGRNVALNNVGNAVLPRGMTANGMAANSTATIRGMSPNGVIMPDGTNGVIGVAPNGTLVSRGIVPGASTITSGGMVAAIGVATPAGTMTPVGVRMPNGMVSNNAVLRACTMTPNCTAAHPCGLTPNCGGAVAVNQVSNNAIALASALQAQGVASGVMQTGGMGMLVNPMTNQPINGITMGGYPQAGYPPIGYAPTGYAPGYPRYAGGMATGEIEEETEMSEEVAAEEIVPPDTRSAMPVPRFHKIPDKPAFQRSEGMAPTPPAQRTVAKPTTTAMTEQNGFSEQEFESALDRAYLEGVSAAMNDVERKLEAKRQAAATAKLQEKILLQAEYVQQQLDEQEQMQMLAMQQMQRERQLQLRQQHAIQQAEMMAMAEPVAEPKRLPKPSAVLPNPPQQIAAKTNNSVTPVQLAEKVNGVFAPLLSSNQKKSVPVKTSVPNPTQKPKTEVAAARSDVPGRPPVAPMPPEYGLLPDDELGPVILQAQFSADDVPIRP